MHEDDCARALRRMILAAAYALPAVFERLPRERAEKFLRSQGDPRRSTGRKIHDVREADHQIHAVLEGLHLVIGRKAGAHQHEELIAALLGRRVDRGGQDRIRLDVARVEVLGNDDHIVNVRPQLQQDVLEEKAGVDLVAQRARVDPRRCAAPRAHPRTPARSGRRARRDRGGFEFPWAERSWSFSRGGG